MAASAAVSLGGGSGSRAFPPAIPGRSAANATSSSGWRAMARRHPVTARLKGSFGASLAGVLGLMFDDMRCSRKALGWYFILLKVAPMFDHLDRGFSMAEPVNHTLHVLREFREEFKAFAVKTDNSFDRLEKKVDRNHEELKQRIENLRQAAFGESVLGRYAAARS